VLNSFASWTTALTNCSLYYSFVSIMSLSTRRPAGIPGSVRPPRSAATTRDWEPTSRTRGDSPPSFGSTGNKYRTSSQSQRSHSAPRQESDDLPRSRHTKEASPLPSAPSRHSAQSSVSSSSSRSSALSAASTAPSSIWDYVGWKTNVSVSESEQVETSSPEPVEFRSGKPLRYHTTLSNV
jgi:hypothetical protein